MPLRPFKTRKALQRFPRQQKPSPTNSKSSSQSLKMRRRMRASPRNRSLASALNISIDRSQPRQQLTETPCTATLPYSPETLDLYLTLSTTSTLSTLQTYETTFYTLATSQTQRSARFPPARSQLRAFIHSLAADWGFISESYDPEPHRHVAVFKGAHWVPPRGLSAEVAGGAVAQVGIGIGGLSVGECVKMRERERTRSREARKAAAAAERSRGVLDGGGDGDSAAVGAGSGDGWAQVASRKRPTAAPPESALVFGEVGGGDKGRTLVLRSGVGLGGKVKGKAGVAGSGSESRSEGGWKPFPAGFAEDVVDDWEEEVEKEEKGQLGVSENGAIGG
ncbi:NF-X1 finger transcription factor [Histoplasma capsulatum H143]|uniref:NF-X1 finger transcription factor n=1 Tax=Ajellomyces capsulatus (strain H143) TaxID=544712 RepID=C6HS28_AJECH|nr:NF-X1 finger transcription factor [Histoplasma capsulatum H143]